ncbi:MAG: hypothetical protein EPN50_09970 [Chloroflexota bacterium]|nr:MAG: hypothetical protein EPN50_09970 [Chloroflexota bacterium]
MTLALGRSARPEPGGGTAPLALIERDRRWTARASTIAGVQAELSRIWSRAALEETAEGLSEKELAAGRGDPHLAGRFDERGDVRVRTRTSVLTLVVMAQRPETVERALDAVNALATRHPSRAVVLAPGDPDGPTRVDARIFCQCTLSERGGSETCTEQILLNCAGEVDQHLAELAMPLLIHDLPVVVWWPDEPPIGRQVFHDLCQLGDRILVDSGGFRDDGARHLAGLAEVIAAGHPTVHDIAWMRLTLWRELVAGLFDHPLLAPELGAVRSVHVDVSRPGAATRLTRAALFVGWLAAALGWQLEAPLVARRGSDEQVATYRAGRQAISVVVRPVPPGDDRHLRSAGSLVRAELGLGRRGHDVRARVTRHADHLLATADWQGAQVSRRAGRLELFGEAPYLGEALDRSGRDRVFERAVAAATRLLVA